MKRATRMLGTGLLGLSACSSIHPVPEPEATFTDEYVRELAGLPPAPGGIAPASNVYVDDESSFRALARKASTPKAGSDVIGLYLKTGFALDDMYCAQYFEKLTHDQALLESAKTQTGLVGGLTSAMMGIFNAGSAATGAVGAGFSFLTASMDNINTSFLLTPNIESIHDLVTDTHVTMVQNLPKGGFDNFPDAHVFLLRYVRVCTFAGVKDLIDRSVKTSVPSSNSAGQISMNVVSAAAAGASGSGTSDVVSAAATAAASAASAAVAAAASAASAAAH